MAIIPIRKPRPFAGARGRSLKELYSAMIGTIGVTQLNVVKHQTNKRYNTEVYVLEERASGNTVDKFKTVLYSRMTITEVFKLANFQVDENEYKATAFTEVVEHPLSSADVLKIFNGKHGCDFEDEDIKITFISGSLYTIEARPKSLGYVGKAEINIGNKIYVPLIPTEHALFNSEAVTVQADNILINNTTVDLTKVEQFKQTGIIFKDFDKLGGGKLTYLLNTNPVSLTVVATGKEFDPAIHNINETVQPTRNELILSPFVESTVERVAELLEVPNRLRTTTWLSNQAELNAIFKVFINGTEVQLEDLVASEEVEVLKVGNVVEITNLTYAPMNVQLKARTISLPALEDPKLTFLTFENQPGLTTDGYEVYNLQLAAADLPLTELVIEHTVPVDVSYNTLAAKLGTEVGTRPIVVTDMLGKVIEVKQLNHKLDRSEDYVEIVNIDGSDKILSGDVYQNGLLFLDAFRIPAESFSRLVDHANLDKVLLTIERKDSNGTTSTANLSFNDLQSRGFVEQSTQDFIFGFIGYGNITINTVITYPEVVKKHLGGTVRLNTKYDIFGEIAPRFTYLTQEQVDTFKTARPNLVNVSSKVVLPTIPVEGFALSDVPAFTVNINPTEQEILTGRVNYTVPYGVFFNDAFKPLLDYAVANSLEADVILAITPKVTTSLGIQTFSLDLEHYRKHGYSGSIHYVVAENRYYVPDTMWGVVKTSNLTYVDGVSTTNVEENVASVKFDPDSSLGNTFYSSGSDIIIKAIHNVTLTELESPTFKFPTDMDAVLSSVGIDQGMNAPDGHHYVQLTNNLMNVNLAELEATFNFAVELEVTPERLQYLIDNYNPSVTLTVDGESRVESLQDLIEVVGGRCFFFTTTRDESEIELVIDVDGDGVHYGNVVSTLNVIATVIAPPQEPTMLVDQAADEESQQNLLTHVVSGTSTVVEESPFEIYKAPTNVISDIAVSKVVDKSVIDGSVNDIDERALIGIEFRMYLTEQEFNEFKTPTDLVAIISKDNTDWKLNLTRELLRKQSYIKDGMVHTYLLLKVNPEVIYNGDYTVEIDWDGIGTNDNYVLDGTFHNGYKKQTIKFQLDVDAVYLPVDLESVRVWWYTNQKEVNTLLTNPTDTTFIKEYPVNEAVPVDDLSFHVDGNYIETSIYQDEADTNKKFTLLINTDLTDEIVSEWLPKASITLSTDGKPVTTIDAATFIAMLHRDNTGKHYLRRTVNAVNAENQSLVYTIDLDDNGKRYKKTISTLLHTTIVTLTKPSPLFKVAENQLDLALSIADGVINVAGFNDKFIYPEYYNYLEITDNSLNIVAVTPEQTDKQFIAVLYELLVDPATLLATISKDTTLTVTARDTDVPISIRIGDSFSRDIITYEGKNYIIVPVPVSGTYTDDFHLDMDASARLWRSSKSVNTVNTHAQVIKESPTLEWVDNATVPFELITASFIANGVNVDQTAVVETVITGNDVYLKAKHDAGSKGLAYIQLAELKGTAEAIDLLINGENGTVAFTDADGASYDLEPFYNSKYYPPFMFNGKGYMGIVVEFFDEPEKTHVLTLTSEHSIYYAEKESILDTVFELEAPPIVDISCVDVPNETQHVKLNGLYTVKVDGVDLLDGGRDYTYEQVVAYYEQNNVNIEGVELPVAGHYWTEDEIAIYFNKNATKLGVTVDLRYHISCADAPVKTKCLSFNGTWDVFVDNRLVGTNVAMHNIINTLGVEEVIAEDCNIQIPTADVTTQIYYPDELIDIEVNGEVYTDLTPVQVIMILSRYGVEACPVADFIPS